MTLPYHAGELAVQARAGVDTEAARISKSLHTSLPAITRDFLQSQSMLIASTTDPAGRVWASLLSGEPGFVKVLDEQTFEIHALPHAGDPLATYVQQGGSIGLLAIDLATRKRMRVNGRVEYGQESLVVHTHQVYANCHKYIQARSLTFMPKTGRSFPALHTKQLTDELQNWIRQADTFFIASRHPEHGADASHRGGLPGFIHLDSATRLAFPDYPGNRMFQTLGNLSIDPHAGLLFLDFERGNTLQLTGKAEIIWDEAQVKAFVGAERIVMFTLDEAIEIRGANPLRGQLLEYSPTNPGISLR